MTTANFISNSNSSGTTPEPFFQRYYKRHRNESLISVSSASSCHSDSSEEAELNKISGAPEVDTINNNNGEEADCRRSRSMSDGGANSRLSFQQEPFEVFPSLPDSVLEKMGLLGSGTRERLGDDELEQKFVALSLAFSIDAATIKDRCDRQRRYRDQTEKNVGTEIHKLIQRANMIQPLCVDAETTELLSALLAQINIVMKAASHATISSERYGAVQHENRISESVNLMINHVNLLKQQRDSARRQLQYTKRVLQNSTTHQPASPLTPSQQKQFLSSPNGKVSAKRRASIAAISQPVECNNPKFLNDSRKITRRISDLSIRASSLTRSTRPSRLELGGDLVKIKEGMVENEQQVPGDEGGVNDQNITNEIREGPSDDNLSSPEDTQCSGTEDGPPLKSLRFRIYRRARKLYKNYETRYLQFTEENTIHEICYFCALVCFSVSILTLANVFIELELAKRDFMYNSAGGGGLNVQK